MVGGVVTATVMEEGAETIDLGSDEYWTLTGVWGRAMSAGLMLAAGADTGSVGWWMMVLGWTAWAGAGVMVVPSR